MKNKKKLLITTGCSFTEGVGCYLPEVKTEPNFWENDLNYIDSLDRFHEFGWPNVLGNLLNYDKVINLGLGGSSCGSNVRHFVERILPMDLSEWEVLVVWLLPSALRASFYFECKIESKMPYSMVGDDFDKEYVKKVGELPEFNSGLDQLFYVKVMEQICENNGFELLMTSADNNSEVILRRLYPDAKYLTPEIYHIFNILKHDFEKYYSPCFHPNEVGYEVIGNHIFELIKENHPHLLNENKPEKFEWVWEGGIEDHKGNHDLVEYIYSEE